MLMLRCVQYFFSTFHPAFSFTFQNPVNPEASFTQIPHAFVLFSAKNNTAASLFATILEFPCPPRGVISLQDRPTISSDFWQKFLQGGGTPPSLHPPPTADSAFGLGVQCLPIFSSLRLEVSLLLVRPLSKLGPLCRARNPYGVS